MDRPESQPSKDLLDIYGIGAIMSMTFNKDATDENFAEAEHQHGYQSSFTYEMAFDLVGERGNCTVGENALDYIQLHNNSEGSGGWRMKYATQKFCEEWLKWVKSEEKELKTYRRLQKKFQGV